MISAKNTFARYRPGALLKVTGDDAFSFLQGQFTNELRQPPGSATYGLWLNQKGKVLADSHVLRIAETELLVISLLSPATVIRQRLEAYIVADDLVLADETAGTHGTLLAGPASDEAVGNLFGEIPAAGRFVRKGGSLVWGGRRLPGKSFEILGPKEAQDEFREQLIARGAMETGWAEMDFARISAGIPAVPPDLGATDLPNEGGLDESAISFTKGCYLGQEVMARLKNLGQVRRRLRVVRGRGAAPAPRSALYQGEKKIGEIRSVASRGEEFAGLAMLALLSLDPAAGLGLEPNGPAVLTLDRHG